MFWKQDRGSRSPGFLHEIHESSFSERLRQCVIHAGAGLERRQLKAQKLKPRQNPELSQKASSLFFQGWSSAGEALSNLGKPHN